MITARIRVAAKGDRQMAKERKENGAQSVYSMYLSTCIFVLLYNFE
jgi:hypothetical protein